MLYTLPNMLKTFVQKIGGDQGLQIPQENCFQYVTAKEKEKFPYCILKIIEHTWPKYQKPHMQCSQYFLLLSATQGTHKNKLYFERCLT